jgi:hypothetical protein
MARAANKITVKEPAVKLVRRRLTMLGAGREPRDATVLRWRLGATPPQACYTRP